MDGKRETLLILAALNEEEALKRLVMEIPGEYDVLLVDSFSTDRTAEIVKKAGYACLEVKYGAGQESGIRTGFEYALEKGYVHVLIMDVDYSDDPRELPKVLSALKEGGYDVVLGIRDFRRQREYLGGATILMKRLVSLLVLLLVGIRVRDANTGVWAFRIDAIRLLSRCLREREFQFSFETLYNCFRLGLKVGEADIGFRRRIGITKLTESKRIALFLYGLHVGLRVLRGRYID